MRCTSCHNKTRERHSWSKESKVKMQGSRNPMWVGDNIKYDALHSWVRRNKPKVDLCECCNLSPPLDLANISQLYLRDLSDFEWLCRKCHMEKDGRINNLKQYQEEGIV